MELHPEFLKKNGKMEFVVLPYEEFVELQELLVDAEDVLSLRQAKGEEPEKPTVPLAELRKALSALGRKGGLTTVSRLTKEQRSERARWAANARWKPR